MEERIKYLQEVIKKHDYLYWSGNPQITDYEYDSYVEQLKKLDPENTLINKINQLVVKNDKKIRHNIPMLSLDKVYTTQDLFKWVKDKSRTCDEFFVIQPKYDGISGKLMNFKNKKEINLSTRGNGYYGENITDKIDIIDFILNNENKELIYGQIIIENNDFKNVFSKIISPSTKKYYKNPRNATSGIICSDDISYFKQNNAKLKFIDYDSNSFVIKSNQFEKSWNNIANSICNSTSYPIDGIVIKLQDDLYKEQLGTTSHHPRWAVAFKFSNPKAKTKIIDIQWSFGKNNLTPVAILSPVELNGVTIERVSLSNYRNVKKLDLKIGDIVEIERAGDVIPHVVNVEKNKNQDERKNPFITKCPCCQTQLVFSQIEIMCPNLSCFAKKSRKLLFALKTIGIKNIGIPTLQKIMKVKNIQSLYQFLQLTNIDLYDCNIGEKTAFNVYNEIHKNKQIYDYQFLTCLNINDVGEEVAKLILNKISLCELIKCKNINNLSQIHGIGDITANKIIEYFKKHYDYIVKLLTCFFIKTTDLDNQDKKTVCFTGEMQNPRSYYENIAKQKNITPVKNVSTTLTYLVTNNINYNSTKIKKAKKYGINIITVDQFLEL